jgi:hypothetical protein
VRESWQLRGVVHERARHVGHRRTRRAAPHSALLANVFEANNVIGHKGLG